jgi:hypothetical protein
MPLAQFHFFGVLSVVVTTKKGAGNSGAENAREMRSSEGYLLETYLLSAIGLAPRSRRPLTAVRAARAAGIFAAAAP